MELTDAPDAVPRARAFVRQTLAAWGVAGVTPDAELVATELATNALLHAGPPVRLELATRDDGVRIEVFDGSRHTPMRSLATAEAMTGRGLAVVQSVAAAFGVEPRPDGKVVWVELTAQPRPAVEPDLDPDVLLAVWGVGDDVAGPDSGPDEETRFTVTLGEVPVDLLLAAKAHIDNLVREFTLAASGAAAGTTEAVPPHLADLISTVVTRFAEARQSLKRQALDAHARGDTRVTLTLTAPPTAALAGQEYLAALDEADEYARAARLLTLESPPAYRVFRRWYVGSLVAQLDRAAAGLPPVPPPSFEDQLVEELGELTRAQRVSSRTARLQAVTAALARANSSQEVATAVLEEGVRALGASGGGLLVPTDDEHLAVPGTVGYEAGLVSRLRRERRGDELPAAVALRRGEPIWLESAEHRDTQFPDLVEFEPGTVSVCAVPLRVADRVIGAMRFSFAAPRLFDDDEREFVLALAAQTAQALARTELLAAERRVTERLTRLQTLTNALSRSLRVADVARVVVDQTVGQLDATLVTLTAPARDGTTIQLLAHAGEPVRSRDANHLLPAAEHVPAATEAIRTAEPVVFANRAERDRTFPGLADTAMRDDRGVISLPLVVGDRVLGALSMSFHGGVRPAQDDLAFLRALADACAQALDRARAWEDAEHGRERLAFLARASAELAGTLDYRSAVAKVVQLAVPDLADWCSVELAEDGRFRNIAVGHVDPERVQLAHQLQERYPADPDAPVGTAAVVRTGVSELHTHIDEDWLARFVPDEEQRQLVRDLGLRSALVVPLPAGGEVAGALTMILAESGRNYSASDVPFAEELGRQLGLALERARLFLAERSARERTTFLARATEQLSSSLESVETVDNLARLLVPVMADWAVVFLIDNTEVVATGVRHADPAVDPRLRAAILGQPLPPGTTDGVAEALQTGRSLLYPVVPESVGARATARLDPALADRLRPRTGMAVPLAYRGEVLGVVALARADGPGYDDSDLALAEELAARAVVALVNARQYGRERDAALTLQTSLLPRRLPDVPGLQFTWRYLPGAAGTQIGGDWYDVIQLDNGDVVLVIGDVMGRGLQAAAVMGQLRATARAHAIPGTSPAEVLRRLGIAVDRLEQALITTALVAVLRPGDRTLTVASAGHLPPLLTGPGSEPSYLPVEPGPPLGAGAVDCPELHLRLPVGATLLLFTDGLVEDRDLPVDQGMALLRGAARGTVSPNELCDAALAALGRLDGHEDDTAMLAVTLTG